MAGTSAGDWMIVGLGNPGRQYERTRHNTGFRAVDRLAERLNIRLDKAKFSALLGQGTWNGCRVILLKPQTFMNLSGQAVSEAARFYKIPADHVLVISDDVSLPAGKLRIRGGGSAGGHNGLKNIILHLGTENFPRLRVGVGSPPHPDYDMADWVLSSFKGKDAEDILAAAARAAEAVECYITKGADRAMNLYN